MPITLPDPDQFQRRIPQATRGIVQAADTSAIARGTQAIAGSLASVSKDIDDYSKRIDDMAAEDAMNEFLRESMNLTIGEDGYKKVEGGNVITGKTYDTYKARMGERYSAIEGKLKNDRQKEAFKRASERVKLGFETDLTQHVTRQIDKYDGDVLKSTLETNKTTAAQRFNTIDSNGRSAEIEALAERSVTAIDKRAQRLGMEPQLWKNAQAEGRSAVYAEAIMSAIDSGKVDVAEKYLKSYGAQMTESDRERIAKPLADQKVTAAANEIYEVIESSSMSEGEAAKQVAQIKDPVLRKRVREQANAYYDDMKAAKDEAYYPVSSLLGDANRESKIISRQEADKILIPLRRSNPDLYDKGEKEIYAHNEKIRTDRDQAKKRAEDASGGGSAAVWYSLKTDPKSLRSVNLMELKDKGWLSDKHFNNLVEDQQALIGKDQTKKEETILADKSAVDLVLKGAKIETGTRGDPAVLGPFYEKFDARVKKLGDNPSQQQKIDVARELLKEVTVDRLGPFNKSVNIFQLTDEQAAKVIVPDEDKLKIMQFIKSKGLQPTEDVIRQIYVESLR